MFRKVMFVAGLGMLFVLAGIAEAATIHVALNGKDDTDPGDDCGAPESPCRTLTFAIVKAAVGDKIIVGPGRYGDLDGDGTFGEPGEETAEVDAGCDCMIKIDKRLTIESRDGAFVTILDAGGAAINVAKIEANNVIFGGLPGPGRGFTLTGAGAGSGCGLLVKAGFSNVKVIGNLAVRNSLAGFCSSGGTGHVFRENTAIRNKEGFDLSGDNFQLVNNRAFNNYSNGFSITGDNNLLRGNAAGFNGFGYKDGFDDGSDDGGSGFLLVGLDIDDKYVLEFNFSSGNRENGFSLSASGRLLGNFAIGNGANGFNLAGGSFAVRGSVALGNVEPGIYVGSSATIRSSNIFGNDPGGDCGLETITPGTVDARFNFWGSNAGPDPDPGLDAPDTEPTANGICPPDEVPFAPFLTTEARIRGRPAPIILEAPDSAIELPEGTIKLPSPELVRFLPERRFRDAILFSALGEFNALRVEIRDLAGRLIYDSGFVESKTLSWASSNTQGRPLANGVYLYVVSARGYNDEVIRSQVKKLVILRQQQRSSSLWPLTP